MERKVLESKSFETMRVSKYVFGIVTGLLFVAMLLYCLAVISGGDKPEGGDELIVISLSPFFFIDQLNVGLKLICSKLGIIDVARYAALFLQIAFLFVTTMEGVTFYKMKNNVDRIKDVIIFNKIQKIFAILIGIVAVFEIYAFVDIMFIDKGNGPIVFMFGLLYLANAILGSAFCYYMCRLIDAFTYVINHLDEEMTEEVKEKLKSCKSNSIVISIIVVFALGINCFTTYGLTAIYLVIWGAYIWSITSVGRFVNEAEN